MHESRVTAVLVKCSSGCVQEPIHKLAWTLDACLNDRTLDARRTKELQTFFALHDTSGEDLEPLAVLRCLLALRSLGVQYTSAGTVLSNTSSELTSTDAWLVVLHRRAAAALCGRQPPSQA